MNPSHLRTPMQNYQHRRPASSASPRPFQSRGPTPQHSTHQVTSPRSPGQRTVTQTEDGSFQITMSPSMSPLIVEMRPPVSVSKVTRPIARTSLDHNYNSSSSGLSQPQQQLRRSLPSTKVSKLLRGHADDDDDWGEDLGGSCKTVVTPRAPNGIISNGSQISSRTNNLCVDDDDDEDWGEITVVSPRTALAKNAVTISEQCKDTPAATVKKVAIVQPEAVKPQSNGVRMNSPNTRINLLAEPLPRPVVTPRSVPVKVPNTPAETNTLNTLKKVFIVEPEAAKKVQSEQTYRQPQQQRSKTELNLLGESPSRTPSKDNFTPPYLMQRCKSSSKIQWPDPGPKEEESRIRFAPNSIQFVDSRKSNGRSQNRAPSNRGQFGRGFDHRGGRGAREAGTPRNYQHPEQSNLKTRGRGFNVIYGAPSLPTPGGKENSPVHDSAARKGVSKGAQADVEGLQRRISKSVKSEECGCEKCDGWLNCPAWMKDNTMFDGFDTSQVRRAPPLLCVGETARTGEVNVHKLVSGKILLHGCVIPKPVNHIDKIYLNSTIKSSLKIMGCTRPNRTQSFTWPSIQRKTHTVIVGPPRTGKTLSYLPSFCMFACEKTNNYAILAEYCGPLVVIVCNNSANCDSMYRLIDDLIGKSEDKPIVKILTEEPANRKKIDCDILVATPQDLEVALKASTLSLKRVCHVALEDADTLLRISGDIAQKFLMCLNAIQANRPHNKSIQIVAHAQKWSKKMETFLKDIYSIPFVCFSDFVEAFLYSEGTLIRDIVPTDYSRAFVQSILRDTYHLKKSVLFCQEKDIDDLVSFFQVAGIENVALSERKADENEENFRVWSSLNIGQLRLLICTDEAFATTDVTEAVSLVHYCVPKDWEIFKRRFRCMASSLGSPFEEQDKAKCCTHIMLDQTGDNKFYLKFYKDAIDRVVYGF